MLRLQRLLVGLLLAPLLSSVMGTLSPSARGQNSPRAEGREIAKAKGDSSSKIEKWVAQLSSPSYLEREKATKGLRAMGEPALPLLTKAKKTSVDPEAGRRIEQLLADIQNDVISNLMRAAEKEENTPKGHKAALKLLEKALALAVERYNPKGITPQRLPVVTEVHLRIARVKRKAGDYFGAADAYHRADYFCSPTRFGDPPNPIMPEWKEMVTELRTEWSKTVRTAIARDATLSGLSKSYPIVLLHSRRLAGGGYFWSSYSFVQSTADEEKHRNDVQLQFDNGSAARTFEVCMVNGQRNRVADLGKVDFLVNPDSAPAKYLKPSPSSYAALLNHVYMEKIEDSDGNDFSVLFQIVAVDEQSRFMAFIWRRLPGGKAADGAKSKGK